METKPSSSPVVDSTRDKLCRESAERHKLGKDTREYSGCVLLRGVFIPWEAEVIALREAYDKGHDAGAREQREKDATLVEDWAVANVVAEGGGHFVNLAHRPKLAAAIRAGRE